MTVGAIVMDKERKLIGKAFKTVYRFNGEEVSGVLAQKIGDGTYRLTCGNGVQCDVVIGEQVNDFLSDHVNKSISGTVMEEASNALRVGEVIIPVGEDLSKEFRAIPLGVKDGDDRYLIKTMSGKGRQVIVGKTDPEYGMVSYDKYGNLRLSKENTSCLVVPKSHEVNIVIFSTPGVGGKGNEAYINIVKPGDRDGSAGQKGTFYSSPPPKQGKRRQPAKFCVTPKKDVLEEYGLGNDRLNGYLVAAFFPTSSTTHTSCSLRSLNDALSERYMFLLSKEVEGRINNDCTLTGLSFAEHPDKEWLDEIKENLSFYNKDCYESDGMYVDVGHELFGMPEKAPAAQPGMSR